MEFTAEQHINHNIEQQKIISKEYGNSFDTNKISDGYHTFGELYEHRITLFIALCGQLCDTNTWEQCPIWRTPVEDGWFILGAYMEKGKQITYHLPESKWHDTEFARDVTKDHYEFDGHTSVDVLERLKKTINYGRLHQYQRKEK